MTTYSTKKPEYLFIAIASLITIGPIILKYYDLIPFRWVVCFIPLFLLACYWVLCSVIDHIDSIDGKSEG